MTPLLLGGIGMQEILLIALVVLLFFGGRKIPELMKGLGQGVRSFKEELSMDNKQSSEMDKTSPDKETKEAVTHDENK